MNISGYEIKDRIIRELGRFVVLWNIFERQYCGNYATSKSINEVAEEITIDLSKLRTLSEVLNARRHYYEHTIIEYVDYSLHPINSRLSKEDDIKLMQDFMEQVGDKINTGCLLVILRIRNNLMHGLKTIDDINDQYRLFSAVNGVLESIARQ